MTDEEKAPPACVTRAVNAVTESFTNPRNQLSLEARFSEVHQEGVDTAWKAALAVSPTEALLAEAKKFKVYSDDAILVPEDPTDEWIAEQVSQRAETLNTNEIELWTHGAPWAWVNITLVTRDGQQHHLRVESLRPWPPTREAAEASVRAQVTSLLRRGPHSEETP